MRKKKEHGGARVGAGRKPKATPLKAKRCQDPAANDGKVMPLDLLLIIMRDPAISMAERADMAKACLLYCHARLAQTQQSDHPPDHIPLHVRLAYYTRQLANAGSGKVVELQDQRSPVTSPGSPSESGE
jgi:hypothetical protein